MPDFYAILSLYRMRAEADVTGALVAERADVSSDALDQVSRTFLTVRERDGWKELSQEARAARLRLGYQRFRRWEATNPDIAALLRRKARAAALG
ncbi:MAG: hypothetical protein AAFR47_16310 [Pseudomonadota bacterium]